MSRGIAWFVHTSAWAVGVTGLVYAWMRYLCVPADDDFALFNHPLEPDLKAWHIWVAPLLVFAVGLLWRSHVWARIRGGQRPRRRDGIALALLFAPMVLTGPLLQTAVDEGWRTAWVWIHAGTGIAWVVLYPVHQIARRRHPASESAD